MQDDLVVRMHPGVFCFVLFIYRTGCRGLLTLVNSCWGENAPRSGRSSCR